MEVQNRDIVIGGYCFDEKNHLHTLDGKPLTGVTTVLSVINKPALIQWAANMTADFILASGMPILQPVPEGEEPLYWSVEVPVEMIKEARTAHKKKKEDAGTKGTEIHSQIEIIINEAIEHFVYQMKDGYIREVRNVSPQVDKFVKWAIENKVKFLFSEKHLYSREWWCGGIADFICEIDGKRYIGDVKTSSGIYPEHFIQTSAYAKMAVEMGIYEKFDGVIIINCDKKGGFKTGVNFDLEGNQKCFEAALTLYRHLNAIK